MKIEIEIDDVDILESFEDYEKEYRVKDCRRWGRISWLYPGEIVVQISDKSAAAIKEAIQNENTKQQQEETKTT
jgi:hypothetical protein